VGLTLAKKAKGALKLQIIAWMTSQILQMYLQRSAKGSTARLFASIRVPGDLKVYKQSHLQIIKCQGIGLARASHFIFIVYTYASLLKTQKSI
jgi:hypothetical protein